MLKTEEEEYAMYDAMVRFLFKENPDELSDMEYARRVKELRWLSESGFFDK
jgi:hypothetical protein